MANVHHLCNYQFVIQTKKFGLVFLVDILWLKPEFIKTEKELYIMDWTWIVLIYIFADISGQFSEISMAIFIAAPAIT